MDSVASNEISATHTLDLAGERHVRYLEQ